MRSFSRAYYVYVSTILLLLATTGCGYNQLQGLDEEVKGAWAEVQNQYQRRADLVPNLVATVKGAAKFEQDTLQQVIQARAAATSVKVDTSVLDNPGPLENSNKLRTSCPELFRDCLWLWKNILTSKPIRIFKVFRLNSKALRIGLR